MQQVKYVLCRQIEHEDIFKDIYFFPDKYFSMQPYFHKMVVHTDIWTACIKSANPGGPFSYRVYGYQNDRLNELIANM